MRKTCSILKATALEIFSEPLTLLIELAALVLAVFAPTFHYHQFGEATRMARDAGFSAVLVGGGVLSVFATIRAFRREIESGTLEMALSRPLTPVRFFLSKTLGAMLSTLCVAVTVFATALTMVGGAATGGRLAERTGDVARIWGPNVAVAVAVIVVPLMAGGLANWLARRRFVLTTLTVAALLAGLGAVWAWTREGATLGPLVAGALPLVFFLLLLTAAAASFAFRFTTPTACTLSGVFVALLLPFVGNYYLADALSNGGRVSGSYVGLSLLVTVPGIAAFLIWGARARKEA